VGPLLDFGLYLGRPPTRNRRGPRSGPRWREPWEPRWRPDWPSEWIDWPDFRTPRDDQHAATSILDAFQAARSGRRVEVACHGGTGRTGTLVACMCNLAGHPEADAVAWRRQHYRPRAIETRGQRRWIAWFAGPGRARASDTERARRRWHDPGHE
jgi:hypothetical protein